MNTSTLRTFLQSRQPINPNWRIYTGQTTTTLTEVLNGDTSQPFIRQITAKEQSLLALDPNYQVSTEVYQISVSADTIPSQNLTWWLSFDDGATFKRVQILNTQKRAQGAYWRILVSAS